MTSEAVHPQHPRPRDAVAFVRLVLSWLLVAVLALDLIASPLHAHRHDGEWSAGATLWASTVNPQDLHSVGNLQMPTHVEDDDAPGFSHSISALRGHVGTMPDSPSTDESGAAAAWFVLLLRPPATAAATPWPPDRHRAGSSAFKSLPPHGRAPPLHA